MNEDEAAARAWARDVLAGDFVILDTETTGLGIWSQIVQIAIIDQTGRVLLDTLVRPTREPDQQAVAIHGLTNERLQDAPFFPDVREQIVQAIAGKRVIIYNASFDLDMLFQSDELFRCDVDDAWTPLGQDAWRDLARFECAMLKYSAYVGDWSDYHGSYRFQRLPGGDHSALGDARATLRLLERMAGKCNTTIAVPVMDTELEGYKDSGYGGMYVNPLSLIRGREQIETPLTDALSAFVADLMFAFSERAGDRDRVDQAHAWFDSWRRSKGIGLEGDSE